MLNNLPAAGWKDKILFILQRRKAFLVEGESMSPTLKSGDTILVNPDVAIAPGDVVLAQHPFKQSTQIIKRVSEITAAGEYNLLGDNPAESTDSRTLGAFRLRDIRGKVICRLK